MPHLLARTIVVPLEGTKHPDFTRLGFGFSNPRHDSTDGGQVVDLILPHDCMAKTAHHNRWNNQLTIDIFKKIGEGPDDVQRRAAVRPRRIPRTLGQVGAMTLLPTTAYYIFAYPPSFKDRELFGLEVGRAMTVEAGVIIKVEIRTNARYIGGHPLVLDTFTADETGCKGVDLIRYVQKQLDMRHPGWRDPFAYWEK